jgi:hypothetical protein
MNVGMPRADKRDLQLPREIGTDDTDVVQPGDVDDVRLELHQGAKNLSRVPLKQRVIRQVFVESKTYR